MFCLKLMQGKLSNANLAARISQPDAKRQRCLFFRGSVTGGLDGGTWGCTDNWGYHGAADLPGKVCLGNWQSWVSFLGLCQPAQGGWGHPVGTEMTPPPASISCRSRDYTVPTLEEIAVGGRGGCGTSMQKPLQGSESPVVREGCQGLWGYKEGLSRWRT